MKETILNELKAIESRFDVRILFACESGSRAWGFASRDSDYDVRFIYVHRMEYYLSIDAQRDVIELPINDVLDISGWELRKALRLFRKSNAPLYEWLQSPMVYVADQAFVDELKSMMVANYSLRAGMHHYLSMAKGVFESDLSGELVKLKKYFYALRPILAAKWIADFKTIPPMDFDSLRALMPARINILVDDLLGMKVNVEESFMVERNLEINAFIEGCIHDCETSVPLAINTDTDTALTQLFRKFIA